MLLLVADSRRGRDLPLELRALLRSSTLLLRELQLHRRVEVVLLEAPMLRLLQRRPARLLLLLLLLLQQ